MTTYTYFVTVLFSLKLLFTVVFTLCSKVRLSEKNERDFFPIEQGTELESLAGVSQDSNLDHNANQHD